MARRFYTEEQALANLRKLAERWPSNLGLSIIDVKNLVVVRLDRGKFPRRHELDDSQIVESINIPSKDLI